MSPRWMVSGTPLIEVGYHRGRVLDDNVPRGVVELDRSWALSIGALQLGRRSLMTMHRDGGSVQVEGVV